MRLLFPSLPAPAPCRPDYPGTGPAQQPGPGYSATQECWTPTIS